MTERPVPLSERFAGPYPGISQPTLDWQTIRASAQGIASFSDDGYTLTAIAPGCLVSWDRNGLLQQTRNSLIHKGDPRVIGVEVFYEYDHLQRLVKTVSYLIRKAEIGDETASFPHRMTEYSYASPHSHEYTSKRSNLRDPSEDPNIFTSDGMDTALNGRF